MFWILAILFIIIVVIAVNVRIVPQASAYVIERLGGYDTTWGVGIHFKIPFLDRAGGGLPAAARYHKG